MIIAESGSGTAARSPGGAGWRAMWQWTHSRGVGGGKRQRTRKHLVQDDVQRVEIAAGINRAIHSARLFGRHIGKGAGNDLRRRGHRALVRQLGRNPEASEPYVFSVVDEHISRLDVLMYEAVPMDLAERFRQADGDAQEARQVERLPRSRSRI